MNLSLSKYLLYMLDTPAMFLAANDRDDMPGAVPIVSKYKQRHIRLLDWRGCGRMLEASDQEILGLAVERIIPGEGSA